MNKNYTPQESKLAIHIANTLNDNGSLGLHLQYARKYKQEDLLKILDRVMAIEGSKVTSSRAAIYVSIIKRELSDEYAWH